MYDQIYKKGPFISHKIMRIECLLLIGRQVNEIWYPGRAIIKLLRYQSPIENGRVGKSKIIVRKPLLQIGPQMYV